MVKIDVENYDTMFEDVQAMFPLHWEELALYKDKVPLNVNYPLYKQLDAEGKMLMIGARDEGRLIGYFFGIMTMHPHYMDQLVLKMDIFWLHPDYRGKGMMGVKLFRFVEAEAKRQGVHTLYYGSKLHRDCSKLFEYLKMDPVEVYYSKWIGD